MKFRDMSTEMTEQEIITALYMICPDSLYKRYKREKLQRNYCRSYEVRCTENI